MPDQPATAAEYGWFLCCDQCGHMIYGDTEGDTLAALLTHQMGGCDE